MRCASASGRPSLGADNALLGIAALMRLSLAGGDFSGLCANLFARAEADPDDTNAMLDMSLVLQLMDEPELALGMQAKALEIRQIYHYPAAREPAGLRLLALMCPGNLMGNTPLECLLEDSDVELNLLYLAPWLPLPLALPEHDVLFVAIGESDGNRELLEQVEHAIRSWARPVINLPNHLLWTARDIACDRLKGIPGLLMPATRCVDRQMLQRVANAEQALTEVLEEGSFPIIVRPLDSHAGKGLRKINEYAALYAYLIAMPQAAFYVSNFVDYRSKDGQFRKYRIAMINGRPYLCHLAISEHWMIHYLNAGMRESAEKRAEEASAMEHFDADFAQRHAQAFAGIQDRLGLDYLVLDCAETAAGELLIFEVDTSAVVHAMDPVDVFPYKQPQMRKVFAAFRRMLGDAAQRGRSLG